MDDKLCLYVGIIAVQPEKLNAPDARIIHTRMMETIIEPKEDSGDRGA